MRAEQHGLSTESLDDRIDAVIERFEDARSQGSADLAEFLPERTDPFCDQLTIELLRVDLQHGWRQNQQRSLNEYAEEFPHVLSQPGYLSELAYEEYRLRRIGGQQVSPIEYSERFTIDTQHWPDLGQSTVAEPGHASTSVYAKDGRSRQAEKAGPRSLAQLAAGDRFEEFTLLCELGRGAFARVFLAKQTELSERYVVLKITADLQSKSESHYLSRLQHTNIVPIYSVHRQGPLNAICMPFFGACTLRDVVTESHQVGQTTNGVPTTKDEVTADNIAIALRKKHSQVTDALDARHAAECSFDQWSSEKSYIRAVTEIIAQISRGLSFAHEKGIVHRDLKPANVLLSNQGTPMLLDFNLSEGIQAQSNRLLGGTLPYLAPEHLESLQSGKRIAASADVYSLGVIFFELLTGSLPFSMRTHDGIPRMLPQMIRERMEPAPDIRQTNATVSAALSEVIRRMLAPNPDDRYSDASEVHEDLQRHLQDRPLRHAANSSRRELVGKWCRRHPKLTSIWTVSACALVLLMISTWAFARQSSRLNRATFLADIQQTSGELQRIRSLVTIPSKDEIVMQEGLDRARDSLGHFVTGKTQRPSLRELPRGLTNSESADATSKLRELLFLASNAASELGDVRHDEALTVEAQHYQTLVSSLESSEDSDRRNPVSQGPGAQDPVSQDPVEIFDFYADRTSRTSAIELIEKLESYRASNPQDMSAWVLLGNAYARVGRFREAEACYSTCTVMWQDSILPRLLRGNCRVEMRGFSSAEQDLSFVLERQPTLTSARINRAVARSELGMHKAALADLDRALELGARQTRIHFMRGENLLAIGERELAREAFETGLLETPTDEKSWIRRGLAFIGRDDAQALSDFHEALKLNPFSNAARTNAVYVLAERQDETDEAIALLGEAIESTGAARDLAARAVYLARTGQYEQAFEDINTALNDSESSRIVFQAACVYALAMNDEPSHKTQANAYLEDAVRQQPLWVFVAASDSDLSTIHDTPEFSATLTRGRTRLQTPPE